MNLSTLRFVSASKKRTEQECGWWKADVGTPCDGCPERRVAGEDVLAVLPVVLPPEWGMLLALWSR